MVKVCIHHSGVMSARYACVLYRTKPYSSVSYRIFCTENTVLNLGAFGARFRSLLWLGQFKILPFFWHQPICASCHFHEGRWTVSLCIKVDLLLFMIPVTFNWAWKAVLAYATAITTLHRRNGVVWVISHFVFVPNRSFKIITWSHQTTTYLSVDHRWCFRLFSSSL